MLLRSVRFHYAFDQSGLRNFDGKGYPYHRYLRPLGLTYDGSTFVSKTAVLESRRGKEYGEPGNMRLLSDGMTPADFWPDCIYMNFRSWIYGAAANAVGLSGPGLKKLLEKGIWYKIPEPFFISLASTALTKHKRLDELQQMVDQIERYLPFPAPFAIQLNITCPNVDHGHQGEADIVDESRQALAILRQLESCPNVSHSIALIPKINVNFPVGVAMAIAEDPNCDGLCNSNTIPWDEVPERDRLRLFGVTESPLKKRGYPSGGVSGSYLLDHLVSWIWNARKAGLTKPIIAGGGILRPSDVDSLAEVGASAIAVGSVSMLRPWRMQRIIDRANKLGALQRFYIHADQS